MSGRATELLRRPAVLAALLAALVFALYRPTGTFAFVNYDDDEYVVANDGVRGGLSWEGARWAFTTGHAANWHPVTWLSHQLDVELFDMDAGAHHRTNALLHALDAALLLLALASLTGAPGKSAVAAALFALHPLRVESVAWVSERKDLLAAGFAFATLWAYAVWARRGGARRYALALGLFALGLMAKPMLVTLPCVLLLLDAWPLGRLAGNVRARALEKLPFLALAVASSIVTYLVQGAAGAVGDLVYYPFGARAANAFLAYATYVGKTLWPSGLCAFHPHLALVAPAGFWTGAVWASVAFVLGVTVAFVALRRRAPYALVGWLWFLGTLVPVIGLVQVGAQSWAERYTYLPTIGLVIAFVWSVDALARTAAARGAALAAAAGAMGVLAFASARQIPTWRDGPTLWRHAVEVEDHALCHANLAEALERAGDLAGAEQQYARAVQLDPHQARLLFRYARLLRQLGKDADARAWLERSVALAPELGPPHADLGWMLSEAGEDEQALVHLRAAVALLPDDTIARNNLAWVLATSRTHAAPEEALALAEGLCRATRNAQLGFVETLAAALARVGRTAEAADWQAQVVEHVRDPAYRPKLAARLALYRAGKPYLKER